MKRLINGCNFIVIIEKPFCHPEGCLCNQIIPLFSEIGKASAFQSTVWAFGFVANPHPRPIRPKRSPTPRFTAWLCSKTPLGSHLFRTQNTFFHRSRMEVLQKAQMASRCFPPPLHGLVPSLSREKLVWTWYLRSLTTDTSVLALGILAALSLVCGCISPFYGEPKSLDGLKEPKWAKVLGWQETFLFFSSSSSAVIKAVKRQKTGMEIRWNGNTNKPLGSLGPPFTIS